MKGEEQVRMIGLAWRPPVVSFFCSSFVSSLHFLFLPPSLVAAFINWRTFPLFRHELPFHGVNGCHPVAQLLALKSVAFPIECSSRSRSPGANKIRPSIVVTMRLTRSFNQSQPHRSAPNRTKSHQIAPIPSRLKEIHPVTHYIHSRWDWYGMLILMVIITVESNSIRICQSEPTHKVIDHYQESTETRSLSFISSAALTFSSPNWNSVSFRSKIKSRSLIQRLFMPNLIIINIVIISSNSLNQILILSIMMILISDRTSKHDLLLDFEIFVCRLNDITDYFLLSFSWWCFAVCDFIANLNRPHHSLTILIELSWLFSLVGVE